MRILFVVQRYGYDVAGGAEAHCREFASRLAARGHEVKVATTRATSYMDWADAYPPGEETLDGVLVHRLSVREPRDWRYFGPLDSRTAWGRKPVPLYLQREWMRRQGPEVPDLVPLLWRIGPGFDVIVFFTYLYYTTWAGLPAASAVAPTVLHPTAHDEPALQLTLFDTMFRLPSAFAFSTEEESDLVRDRFRVDRLERVIGVGVETDAADDGGRRFRAAQPAVGNRPYLVYVGRVDVAKGTGELVDYFLTMQERTPSDLALVIVGEQIQEIPDHPDIVCTGFVDEDVKRSAIAGATALVHPSYFESFSMVLTEAWAAGRPAIVNGRCPVLEGQVRRSGGGLPYRGFAEFEAAVQAVAGDPALARGLGDAGRRYVDRMYRWDTVIERYETFLELVATRRYLPSSSSASV